MSTFANKITALTEKLRTTLIAKNADYGDSYAKSVDKRGPVITLVRLEDKLHRLERLLDSSALVEESIDDTLLDIAGYALLELERRQRIATPALKLTPATNRPWMETMELLNNNGKPAYADLDD
jgi:Nucleotide modification associated domain 1